MQSKQAIATPDAPPALGPYSQAIRVNDTIYVSGQLPMDPKTRQLIGGSIAAQTEQVLLNIRAILEEGEASLEHVVKMTIYMKDLTQFEEMNRVFKLFFPTGEHSRCLPPARSTVEVSRLPRDAAIEIDAIAVVTAGYVDFEMF